MKTMIEVQYQEKNVKNGDLDKYVKETLKEQGVKTTEVETLNIYYLPETAKVFFVAIKTLEILSKPLLLNKVKPSTKASLP